MKAGPDQFRLARGLGRTASMIALIATLVLMSGRADAQNYPVVTMVPDHVFAVRGASFRNGDLFAIEPSAMFVYGPIRPPLAMVARPILGLGGSGVGIGVAINPTHPCVGDGFAEPPAGELCWKGDDFFMGPFVSIEAHIERMYGLTGWRFGF